MRETAFRRLAMRGLDRRCLLVSLVALSLGMPAHAGEPTATSVPGPVPAGKAEASSSNVAGAVDGGAKRSGRMYVWNIRFGISGERLRSTVTIHQDADRDGVAEFYDDPVPDATVDVTLRHDTDGDGIFDCATDDCRSSTGTTGRSGEVEFGWSGASAGEYEAEVTALSHDSFSRARGIEDDSRAHVTVP